MAHWYLYRKPTAGNTLLHASSAHPKPLVCSIPYAQYLRLCRNCAQEEDFYVQAAALREHLLLRGYSWTTLRRAFNKALSHTRTSFLYPPPCTSCTNTVKIITKYSAHQGQLQDILSKHWYLLTDHHILNKHLCSTPELVFCRANSLKDRLTSSHYWSDTSRPSRPRGTF